MLAPGSLFRGIAWAADYPELEHAVSVSTDRLAEYRAAEAEVLEGVAAELESLADCYRASATGDLRAELAAYHKRRARSAPRILSARRRAIDAPGGA